MALVRNGYSAARNSKIMKYQCVFIHYYSWCVAGGGLKMADGNPRCFKYSRRIRYTAAVGEAASEKCALQSEQKLKCGNQRPASSKSVA